MIRYLPRPLKRLFRANRFLLLKAGKFRIYVMHWEILAGVLLVAFRMGDQLQHRLGMYSAVIILLALHELGHVVFGLIVGWKTKAITLGVFNGLCEYWSDGLQETEQSMRSKTIFVSWGGVAFQFILLLAAMAVYFAGTWPAGAFHDGLFVAFVWVNIFAIIYNLLPFKGFDGENAWDFLKRKSAKDHETENP